MYALFDEYHVRVMRGIICQVATLRYTEGHGKVGHHLAFFPDIVIDWNAGLSLVVLTSYLKHVVLNVPSISSPL